MNSNFEIKILNLIKKISQLPEQDKKNVIEFAQNNEYGLALDSVAHQIYEYNILITQDTFNAIAVLGTEIGIEPEAWAFLKKQII
jgi:hypothetical protein